MKNKKRKYDLKKYVKSLLKVKNVRVRENRIVYETNTSYGESSTNLLKFSKIDFDSFDD